ncbi:hypothetical protein GCM10010424_52990 [Streptomyces lienomycini]
MGVSSARREAATAARTPGQRPVTGGTLITLGRTLRALGFALGAGGGGGLGSNFFSDPSPQVAGIHWSVRVLIIVVVVSIGWLLFDVGRKLLVRGQRHRVSTITSFDHLKGERYLLYLRPFALDQPMARAPSGTPGWGSRSPFDVPGLTAEQFLLGQFSEHGRVVAVGRPGEQLPLLGAQRGYLPLQGWEYTVSELIQGAHVVLMSVAQGPGTAWEFTEVLRTTTPERLILVISCDEREYNAFRTAVAGLYEARKKREGGSPWAPLPVLPDCPVVPRATGREWDAPLRAFVTFDQEWHPTLFPFVVTVPRLRHYRTVRKLVGQQMAPALSPLRALPRRTAAGTVPPPLPADSQSSAAPSTPAPSPRPHPNEPLIGSVLVHHQAATRRRRGFPWRKPM